MWRNRVNRYIPRTRIHTIRVQIDVVTQNAVTWLVTKRPVTVRRPVAIVTEPETMGAFVTGSVAGVVIPIGKVDIIWIAVRLDIITGSRKIERFVEIPGNDLPGKRH